MEEDSRWEAKRWCSSYRVDRFTPGAQRMAPPTIVGPSPRNSSVSPNTFQPPASAFTQEHRHPLYSCPFLFWGPLQWDSKDLLFPEAFLCSPPARPPHWRPCSILPPWDALAFWPGVGHQAFVSLNHMEHIPSSYGSPSLAKWKGRSNPQTPGHGWQVFTARSQSTLEKSPHKPKPCPLIVAQWVREWRTRRTFQPLPSKSLPTVILLWESDIY